MKAHRIAIKRESLGEQQSERVQANANATATALNAAPHILGQQLEPITVTAGSSTIMVHRLGREPRGWMVLDAQTAAWSGYRTAWDAQTITLYSDNAGTYRFWVF